MEVYLTGMGGDWSANLIELKLKVKNRMEVVGVEVGGNLRAAVWVLGFCGLWVLVLSTNYYWNWFPEPVPWYVNT